MSDKPRIATDEWISENPKRIGIYNDDWDSEGNRQGKSVFCWYVYAFGKCWGGGFPSQQDATDWLREELINARVS